jgi:hypothetical protein
LVVAAKVELHRQGAVVLPDGGELPPIAPSEPSAEISSNHVPATTAEERQRLRQPSVSGLEGKLDLLLAQHPPGADCYVALRSFFESLPKSQLQKARVLLGERAGGDHKHPAYKGAATVEKLIAIASGEAGVAELPSSSEDKRIASQTLDRLGERDLGTGRLIDPHDRELWLARSLSRSDVLGQLTASDEEGELFLLAAKHLGFEVAAGPELQAVWFDLLDLFQAGLYSPAAMRPYLEEHGPARLAWAILRIAELAQLAPGLPEDFGDAASRVTSKAAVNG